MSAREHILPVFVPHFGCPHDCVFCNQRHISGEQIPATAETVRRVILEAGQRTEAHEKLQLAFYGGSFTAIPEEDQLFLLQAAREALDEGAITSIRLRLNMTPRRTMMIAQQLYEGVEVHDRGSIGLITYMRTDSLRISSEALAAAGSYIREHYGEAYYHGKPRTFKTSRGAQDAHEAIRPSDVTLSPDMLKGDLNRDQYALYRLIWNRFTASQMANAVYDNLTVDAVSAGHVFRAGSSEVRFRGYTVLYEEAKDEEQVKEDSSLPALSEGDALQLLKTTADQQFTQPPARYTEATLIRAMEEKGIGRPSTYASTVTTITAHDYVTKEGRYLQPTPLGEVVTGYLREHFHDIVDLGFTSSMEEKLDKVEDGTEQWKELLRDFYGEFSEEIQKAKTDTKGEKLKVPDEVTDEICEVCGAHLVKKKGRFGSFLACPNFPNCTFTKPIVIVMPGKCPKCGGRILKRTSRNNNVYYSCEENKPLCSYENG